MYSDNTDDHDSNKQQHSSLGHGEQFYDQQQSTLSCNGHKTKLDPITARLLVYFLDNPDRVISREELSEHIWQSSYVANNTINRGVSVLRKLLGGDLNRYITTVPKQGYRFVHPQPDIVSAPASNANGVNTRWLFAGAVAGMLLLIFAAMVMFRPFSLNKTPLTADTVQDAGLLNAEELNTAVLKIAVLPFLNKNSVDQSTVDKEKTDDQQLFIDGLTDQIINRLTRINGLVVLSAPQQSAANYLLQGSVTQYDDMLRVTVQLTTANSGVYLFSTNFKRKLKDVFKLQENIALQVSSALKVSLIYKEPHYSSALATMDHQGVEQLVIARARLRVASDSLTRQAFDDLTVLNQRYPQTPEVLGLLAWAHVNQTYRLKNDSDTLVQNGIKLAKTALSLDPSNLDALKALYHHYLYEPKSREQAFIVSGQLIRQHPGRRTAWRSRLHLMITTLRPCEEIQQFARTIPKGLFTEHRLNVINHILSVCLQSKPLEGLFALNIEGKTNPTVMNTAINNNLYLFKIYHDMTYDAVKSLNRKRATQWLLTDYYWLQLASGAFNDAAITKQSISQQGFWPLLTSVYDSLYALPEYDPLLLTPSLPLAFTRHVRKNTTTHQLAAALITQAAQSGDNSPMHSYLAQNAQLPANLLNRHENIALMMLQLHVGQQQASQLSGQQLFNKLMVYYKNHRQSFEFWGLGGFTLVAKFYCGEQCALPKGDGPPAQTPKALLKQLFKPEHALWMDDIGFMQVALSPWADDPVVIEYLAQIEQDRVRFRAKFGL